MRLSVSGPEDRTGKKTLSWLKYWKHKVLLKSLNSRTGVVIKKTKRVCEGALYIQVVRAKSALGWSIGSCSTRAEQWCLYMSHVLGEEFFSTCYLCFISAMQLFPTGKQWLLVTWGMYTHTFCWLCFFSVHNRYPHCLPSTWREEERKGTTHHRIIFYFVRKELASHKCVSEKWFIILREQGCFDGRQLCLAERTVSPEDTTSKPGWREVCAAGTVAAQPLGCVT